jgi:hypothetical protein
MRRSRSEPRSRKKQNPTMSFHPFRSDPVAVAPLASVADERAEEAEDYYRHLSAVYALAENNPRVFASPLGPFDYADRHVWLPRFAFFGPNADDTSWRLAFFAGFDAADLRASHALLGFLEFLALHAEEGHGLNLAFFPLVDVAGHLFQAPPRQLGQERWSQSTAPELRVLEKNARQNGYHGFVRVETAAHEEDTLVVRVCAPAIEATEPDVELISSFEVEPFAVRWERGAAAPGAGPLTITDDLPVAPFELTLLVPPSWPDELYRRAVAVVLSKFVLRYRAFQAFGGQL